jgi:uncharacterized glyoxalase superfamily protein PhnB
MAVRRPRKTTKARKRVRARAAAKPRSRRSTRAPRRARRASGRLSLTSAAPGLTVDDIEKSFAWYCDILGFTVTERWMRDDVLHGGAISLGDVTLYLGQDDWQKGRDRKKGEGVRLYWYTDQDVDELAAAIKARGGTLASEPEDGWGARTFSLVDPTGYKITISSQR